MHGALLPVSLFQHDHREAEVDDFLMDEEGMQELNDELDQMYGVEKDKESNSSQDTEMDEPSRQSEPVLQGDDA